MGDLYPIDEMEQSLRADLNDAEKALRTATPEQKAEARRRFKDALHRFSVFVFTGRSERRESGAIGAR